MPDFSGAFNPCFSCGERLYMVRRSPQPHLCKDCYEEESRVTLVPTWTFLRYAFEESRGG